MTVVFTLWSTNIAIAGISPFSIGTTSSKSVHFPASYVSNTGVYDLQIME